MEKLVRAGENCYALRCSSFGKSEVGHCLPVVCDDGVLAWIEHPRSGTPVVRLATWKCPFYAENSISLSAV